MTARRSSQSSGMQKLSDSLGTKRTIRNFARSQIIENAEEGDSLLLEKLIDSLRRSSVDEFGAHGKFSKHGVSCP